MDSNYNFDRVGKGTKSDPFIVPVDLNYPERTPHRFEVTRVEHIQDTHFE